MYLLMVCVFGLGLGESGLGHNEAGGGIKGQRDMLMHYEPAVALAAEADCDAEKHGGNGMDILRTGEAVQAVEKGNILTRDEAEILALDIELLGEAGQAVLPDLADRGDAAMFKGRLDVVENSVLCVVGEKTIKIAGLESLLPIGHGSAEGIFEGGGGRHESGG
jgi:hypothetical protein